MTTADPTPPEQALQAIADAIVIAGVGFGIAMVAVMIYGVILYRAGRLPGSSALVVALAMLTFAALLGAILTSSTDAYNLAAVGIGALAGSLTVAYQGGRHDPSTPDKEPEP